MSIGFTLAGAFSGFLVEAFGFYHDGLEHGISRRWAENGELEEDYPKFFVRDDEVTKAEYQLEASRDPTLPVVRDIDDQPQRDVVASIPRTGLTQGSGPRSCQQRPDRGR